MTVTQQLTAANEYAQLWQALMPDLPAPESDQLTLWAGRYDINLVSQGINRASRKYRKLRESTTPMSAEAVARYASSVMKNELLGIRQFPTGNHHGQDVTA
jgi:hypothetical protein